MTERLLNGDFSLTVADASPQGNSTGIDPANWTVIEVGDTPGAELTDDSVQVDAGEVVFSGGGSPATGAIEQTVTGIPAGKTASFSIDFGENGSGGNPSVLVEILDGDNNVIISQPINVVGTFSTNFTTVTSEYTVRITDTSTGNMASQDATVDNVSLFVPCFREGTRIETRRGPVAVEDLRAGDEVRTRDRGFQPICWIGSYAVSPGEFYYNKSARPVLIPAGALAKGYPEADLLVSPQHRILIASEIAGRMFDSTEILVPAVNLVGHNGIAYAPAGEGFRYFHLLLDHHAIIFAEGCPVETLFTGDILTRNLSDADLQTIRERTAHVDIFDMTPARPFARGKRVRNLLERHTKNEKPVLGMPQTADRVADLEINPV